MSIKKCGFWVLFELTREDENYQGTQTFDTNAELLPLIFADKR
jgi:hypothetical protein